MDVFSAPQNIVNVTSSLLFSIGQSLDRLEINLHILQVEVTI